MEKQINKIYKKYPYLKKDVIKEEFEKIIVGHDIKECDKFDWGYKLVLMNNSEKLTINFLNDFINITIFSDDKIKKMTIEEFKISERTVERYEKGLNVIDVIKTIEYSDKYKKDVITDIDERDYTLSNERLRGIGYHADKKPNMSSAYIKLKDIALIYFNDLCKHFECHMNYYEFDFMGETIRREVKFNPTMTLVNDNDISEIYNIEGFDKISKIHDLYNGVINKNNEECIKLIHLGLLKDKVFHMKHIMSDIKYYYLGNKLSPSNENYTNYLKDFFYNEFGYKGEIKLDRDFLLDIIHSYELTKQHTEKKSGIQLIKSFKNKLKKED